MLPWPPNNVAKILSASTDITCIRCTRLENELQYYDLAVRINSGDDGAMSSKNLVNFCLVTLEMTGLICEHPVRHGQKTGVFFRISPDILEVFSQYFHHMKALYDDGSVPYFPIYQGRCHRYQIILQ